MWPGGRLQRDGFAVAYLIGWGAGSHTGHHAIAKVDQLTLSVGVAYVRDIARLSGGSGH